MANATSNKLEIDTLKQQLADLLSNSKQPKDGQTTSSYGTDSLIPIQNTGEDVKFITHSDLIPAVAASILGSIRRLDDDSNVEDVTAINQLTLGRKTGYYDNKFFLGRVVFYPPTQESHIENLFTFDTF